MPDVYKRQVLDLFAGTGQLGIECLSRGAASAVFVDRRADAVKLIRENLKLTELQDRARVVAGDSMEFLRSLRERFDIVFLDPPYEAGLLEPAVAHLTAFDILNPHGIICLLYTSRHELPAGGGGDHRPLPGAAAEGAGRGILPSGGPADGPAGAGAVSGKRGRAPKKRRSPLFHGRKMCYTKS